MNLLTAASLLVAFSCLSACEDKPKPGPTPPPAASQILNPTAAPVPAAPKELVVDAIGAKVGFTRILLDKPEGEQRLREELGTEKASFAGKDVTVTVERAAKLPWVTKLLAELSKLVPASVSVKTETRKEFPNELPFLAAAQVKEPAPCSVVAMILEDRGTAVWKLSGGVAIKRARGFAGPDLTTTGETLEKFGKGCKDSPLLFVGAAPPVEWGLVFDLAASAKTLPKGSFQRFVALPVPPTPGRPVTL